MTLLAETIDLAPRPGSPPMFVCDGQRIQVYTDEALKHGWRDMFTTMAELWANGFPNVRPQQNPVLPWLPLRAIWHEQTTLPTPTQFPHIAVREIESPTFKRTNDSARQEHHRTIIWQIDAFSNLLPGAGMQVKALLDYIHPIMTMYGWIREQHKSVIMPGSTNITQMMSVYRMVLGRDGIVTQT